MSPILVTLMSSSDSNLERSNISLKDNIPDGIDPNSDGHDYCVRKSEGKILWFSADCVKYYFNEQLGTKKTITSLQVPETTPTATT